MVKESLSSALSKGRSEKANPRFEGSMNLAQWGKVITVSPGTESDKCLLSVPILATWDTILKI